MDRQRSHFFPPDPVQTQRLVLPADLNQYGYLFGGRLLAWIDEASWIAASLDFPQCRFVTVALREVCFRHSVREGTILTIESTLHHRGRTSVTYSVQVRDTRSPSNEPLFITDVTFVNVDDQGHKQAVC
jgi:acyl-CoA hydrolase